MSDEKKYTERDVVLRERAAFLSGRVDRATTYDMSGLEATNRAAAFYPLPKVTRPRVVKDQYGDSWRVVGGCFEFKNRHGGAWEPVEDAWRPTAALVPVWADLLAFPTETVEAEP